MNGILKLVAALALALAVDPSVELTRHVQPPPTPRYRLGEFGWEGPDGVPLGANEGLELPAPYTDDAWEVIAGQRAGRQAGIYWKFNLKWFTSP
jgi:hypothetical protein